MASYSFVYSNHHCPEYLIKNRILPVMLGVGVKFEFQNLTPTPEVIIEKLHQFAFLTFGVSFCLVTLFCHEYNMGKIK